MCILYEWYSLIPKYERFGGGRRGGDNEAIAEGPIRSFFRT